MGKEIAMLTDEQIAEMRMLWDDNEPSLLAAMMVKHAPALLDAAADAVRLRKAMGKVASWLERLAQQSSDSHDSYKGRFGSLADACKADARNYGRVAADCRAALRPAEQGAGEGEGK